MDNPSNGGMQTPGPRPFSGGSASARPGLDGVLAALKFPFQRQIVQHLDEPMSLAQLAEALQEPIDLLALHVALLEAEGLVERTESDELRAAVRVWINVDDRRERDGTGWLDQHQAPLRFAPGDKTAPKQARPPRRPA